MSLPTVTGPGHDSDMVVLAAVLAIIATSILFLLTLTIALLATQQGRRADIAALERQVAELAEKAMTPAEREARAHRRRERAARHRRANHVHVD